MDWFDRLVLGFVTIGISKLIIGWLHQVLLWLGVVVVAYSIIVFLIAFVLTIRKVWANEKAKKMSLNSPDEWLAKFSGGEPKKKGK
jgi:hypothetical protein